MNQCKSIRCDNETYGVFCPQCHSKHSRQEGRSAPLVKKVEAPDLLQAAAGHMSDRAQTYDAPEGERSMGKTVAAFNAITGHSLTETEGWMFMVFLKIARSFQGDFKMDNYEDLVAYAALSGEAAAAAQEA